MDKYDNQETHARYVLYFLTLWILSAPATNGVGDMEVSLVCRRLSVHPSGSCERNIFRME